MDKVQTFHKVKKTLERKLPTILSIAGSLGIVATSVATADATIKALGFSKKEASDVDFDRREFIKESWKYYIPASLIGVSSIACVACSQIINKQQQASLVGAYIFLNRSYKEYKTRVKELYGDDADLKIKETIANSIFEQKSYDSKNLDDKELFYEEYFGEFFESTEREVLEAEYHLNRNFALRGYAELNEFYSFLNLPPTKIGKELEWSIDIGNDYGYSWIDFKHETFTTMDGLKYTAITMPFPPVSPWVDDDEE